MQPVTILLVEDNEDDVFLMKRALKVCGIQNPLQVVEDGQQAIDYLAGNGQFHDRNRFPYPAIVFLDLQLPIKSGFEVLDWFNQAAPPACLIVVLSSSNSPRDMDLCARLGAATYAVKPPTKQLFQRLEEQFGACWFVAQQTA